jgi:hypothetical protein
MWDFWILDLQCQKNLRTDADVVGKSRKDEAKKKNPYPPKPKLILATSEKVTE